MVQHNDKCKMAFGRPSKHSECPRCEELKQGAKPRAWNVSRNDIPAPKHNCKASKCGIVCTWGEW